MDPYKILGVSRQADGGAIKRAYRRLAKDCHPDRHPGDAAMAERFREIAAAYAILGDDEARRQFDAGEALRERPNATSQSAAGAYRRTAHWGKDERPDDRPFAEFFGKGRRGASRSRGLDQTYDLTIDFLTALDGGSALLALRDGRSVSVAIPKAVEAGSQLRLKGQGAPVEKGENGDALVTLHVTPHERFRRDGKDLHLDVPITVRDAVLGGRIMVDMPGRHLAVTVPKGANTGTRLRLKGKGAAPAEGVPGDAYLTLLVMLPKGDAEFEAFVRKWSSKRAEDMPRSGR